MSKRRTAVGIAVLFALALSAFTAASASATGETAFTCVKENPSGPLWGPHCLESGSGEKYKHVEIEPNLTTTGTATNLKSSEGTTAAASATLKATLAGTNTAVTCAKVESKEGTFKNTTTGVEMYAHAEGRLHYTGCEVKLPAGKGCKVKEGTVTTEQLTGRTIGGGKVRIEPKVAEGNFTIITIEGCSVEALNNPFPVKGSLEAKTNGATITSTHEEVTLQNKLRFGGQKAGLEGALTIEAHKTGDVTTSPLSVTPTP